jgi:GNAT superfamily N-acetyltransferase
VSSGAVEVLVDPDDLDLDRVHRWLSEQAYWALGRPRDVVERAAAGSVNLAARVDGELVGYARLVTDRATHAWLCDVFVAADHRGRGIGRALVAAADRLLASYGVQRAVLATHDAHALYADFGFVPLARPDHWMVRSYRAED